MATTNPYVPALGTATFQVDTAGKSVIPFGNAVMVPNTNAREFTASAENVTFAAPAEPPAGWGYVPGDPATSIVATASATSTDNKAGADAVMGVYTAVPATCDVSMTVNDTVVFENLSDATNFNIIDVQASPSGDGTVFALALNATATPNVAAIWMRTPMADEWTLFHGPIDDFAAYTVFNPISNTHVFVSGQGGDGAAVVGVYDGTSVLTINSDADTVINFANAEPLGGSTGDVADGETAPRLALLHVEDADNVNCSVFALSGEGDAFVQQGTVSVINDTGNAVTILGEFASCVGQAAVIFVRNSGTDTANLVYSIDKSAINAVSADPVQAPVVQPSGYNIGAQWTNLNLFSSDDDFYIAGRIGGAGQGLVNKLGFGDPTATMDAVIATNLGEADITGIGQVTRDDVANDGTVTQEVLWAISNGSNQLYTVTGTEANAVDVDATLSNPVSTANFCAPLACMSVYNGTGGFWYGRTAGTLNKPSSGSSDDGGLSTGAIIGIVLGSVAAVVIIGVGIAAAKGAFGKKSG